MRHLKLAFRTLFKTPFVTAVAVLSLALGIGANAAIFSLFDQILLRRCRCSSPAGWSTLGARAPSRARNRAARPATATMVFSYPMFRDLERTQTVLHRARGAPRLRRQPVVSRTQPTTGRGMFVSGSYFPTLGLTPGTRAPARPYDDADHRRELRDGAELRLLAARFGSRSVGRWARPSLVNGQTMTIVGVAPTRIRGHHAGHPAAGVRADHHARACSRAASAGSRIAAATGSICSADSSRACRSSRPSAGLNAPLPAASSPTSRRRCRRG